MENRIDELYEILDDMNARIEEIVNDCQDPDALDYIIPKLQQKAQEFIYDVQLDVESAQLVGVEV